MLAALSGLSPPALQRRAALAVLEALGNDDRALARVAAMLPEINRVSFRIDALAARAQRDTSSALRSALALDSSMARRGYARANPEAARAWAQNLSPRTPAVLAAVLEGIARDDVARAIELGLGIRVGTAVVGNVPQFPPINSVLFSAAQDSARAVLAADRLIAMENVARRDYLLNVLLQQWADRDPEALIGWVSVNANALGEQALSGTAVALASRDPALAARYTGRIPAALRAAWIARVAQGYARADPTGALEWISQYRGQEGYDAGLQRIIVDYATDDPAAAARVLETAGTELQLGTVATVTDRWARQDAAAAAEWALRLRDENVRAAALPEAVGAWMSQSAQSAEDWVLGLRPGADRDRALYVLLRGRTLTDRPRESYSNHSTEALIAQVSDPAMRAQIEAWFADAGGRGR